MFIFSPKDSLKNFFFYQPNTNFSLKIALCIDHYCRLLKNVMFWSFWHDGHGNLHFLVQIQYSLDFFMENVAH